MTIVFQVLTVLMSCLCKIQKDKDKSLIFLILTLVFSLITLYLFGQVAGFFMSILALLRVVVYFIYDKLKLKPNIFVLITFEIAAVVIAVVTWNSWVDLLIIASVIMINFSTWQNNMKIFRISMIIDPILYIIYNTLIGAYVSITGDAIGLIVGIYALVYYDVLKRSTSIFKRVLFYVKPRNKRKRLKQRLQKRKA